MDEQCSKIPPPQLLFLLILNADFYSLIQRLLIAREYQDKAAERRAFSNLGNAHVFLGEFEIAVEYYKYVEICKLHMWGRALCQSSCN